MRLLWYGYPEGDCHAVSDPCLHRLLLLCSGAAGRVHGQLPQLHGMARGTRGIRAPRPLPLRCVRACADGATLYLQKDGSVAATTDNAYTCQGKPGAAVEIAGQSVAAWDKGHKVVYTFDAAANHFAISTAAE